MLICPECPTDGLGNGLGNYVEENSLPICCCSDSVLVVSLAVLAAGRVAHYRTDGSRRHGLGQLRAGREGQSANCAGASRVQGSGGAAAGRTVCRDAGPRTFLLRQRDGSTEHGMVLLPRSQRTFVVSKKATHDDQFGQGPEGGFADLVSKSVCSRRSSGTLSPQQIPSPTKHI